MPVIAFSLPTTPPADPSPEPGEQATEPSTSEVRAELERVLRSSQFSRSERLRRFLKFVVDEKLAGRATHLKEYLIGNEVYDRGPTFNPATDTIVRVEARRLRSTLRAHYHESGQSAAVFVYIPKGGYEPFFRRTAPGSHGTLPCRFRLSSVAVLSFENLSGDEDCDYFCAGLTDEIVCALTQVDGLRVAARSPTRADANIRDGLRTIGTTLNVGGVVEGRVRRVGQRLRITARLVNISDGYNVWSRRFERALEDEFAIQDEVADAVVEAFRQHGRDGFATKDCAARPPLGHG